MLRELLKGEFILFEFEDYCVGGEFNRDTLCFYNCTLSVSIGNFKVGSVVPTIVIHFVQKGTLQVRNKEGLLLSEHDYTGIGYDLEGKRVISLSSDSNIRELLQINK